MRKETKESSVSIVQPLGNGEWAVRWDFKPKLDINGKENGVNWYEEEILLHIPQLDEIKEMITSWQNKQVDGAILQGCRWNGMPVWLSMENQFNYKSVFDLAAMTEPQVQEWDAANPGLAGQEYILQEVTDDEGHTFPSPVPTGRPHSVLPVQFKFGTAEEPQYHTFTTLKELTEFYIFTMSYIQSCYTSGWTRKDSFDYSAYQTAIEAL